MKNTNLKTKTILDKQSDERERERGRGGEREREGPECKDRKKKLRGQ